MISNEKYKMPNGIKSSTYFNLVMSWYAITVLSIAKMMCPALRLAVSRKDKVKGRIVLLIPSTRDKKGLIIDGEFSGIWDLKDLPGFIDVN